MRAALKYLNILQLYKSSSNSLSEEELLWCLCLPRIDFFFLCVDGSGESGEEPVPDGPVWSATEWAPPEAPPGRSEMLFLSSTCSFNSFSAFSFSSVTFYILRVCYLTSSFSLLVASTDSFKAFLFLVVSDSPSDFSYS